MTRDVQASEAVTVPGIMIGKPLSVNDKYTLMAIWADVALIEGWTDHLATNCECHTGDRETDIAILRKRFNDITYERLYWAALWVDCARRYKDN